MEISTFKCRCLVCFKGFEVARLPDSSYGEWLFISSSNDYWYYSLAEAKFELVDLAIKDFLKENVKYQQMNDDDKGNTFVKLIAKAAVEDVKPVFYYDPCPRCGSKFHSFPNKRISNRKIKRLTFPKTVGEIRNRLDRYN